MESPVAIGVDLSLTRTGVALVGSAYECSSFGRKGKRSESLWERAERIEETVGFVLSKLTEGFELPKIAVLEYPSTMAAGGSTLDRDHLWWKVVELFRIERIPLVVPITQKLKIYATGRGTKHDKGEVMLSMLRRIPSAPFANDDEADAFVLALMGARLIGEPCDKTPPQTHLRALDGLVINGEADG